MTGVTGRSDWYHGILNLRLNCAPRSSDRPIAAVLERLLARLMTLYYTPLVVWF